MKNKINSYTGLLNMYSLLNHLALQIASFLEKLNFPHIEVVCYNQYCNSNKFTTRTSLRLLNPKWFFWKTHNTIFYFCLFSITKFIHICWKTVFPYFLLSALFFKDNLYQLLVCIIPALYAYQNLYAHVQWHTNMQIYIQNVMLNIQF